MGKMEKANNLFVEESIGEMRTRTAAVVKDQAEHVLKEKKLEEDVDIDEITHHGNSKNAIDKVHEVLSLIHI